ncbi:MAG: PAS domain S-box protein [Desulfobacteraceae bacterium]|mgnify:CR=1 FL=1|nr:MAG: PAS domain S-box protein [Desulfobacteraceae bacterium]
MHRLFFAFQNLGIRYKLLSGYTLIFILSTLIGGVFIYYKVRTTIESNIESELTNATATIKNMVETAASTSIKNHLRAVAEKNKEIVEQIYQDHTAGKLTLDEAKARARGILFSQTIGKTGYIYCADSKGIAIEHPVPGVAGKNFMDREFVRIMIRQKQGYLEYDWKNPGEATERPKAMYMSYFEPWDWIISVSSYQEEFKELINISDFKESILELTFGKTGYAYITDSKGNLIVHPFLSGNFSGTKDRFGNYFVDTITGTKNGKIIYSWKNPGEQKERDKIVIFNYLPEYDWIVASASYLDEIYAPLKTIRTIIILTAFMIIALGFLTSLWVNNLVINPLKSLMQRISSSTSGNFSTRMPVRSSDEIGQLAGFFNAFMDKLEKYSANLTSEIKQHKETASALASSEENYRLILERMEEGYFEVDLNGRFIFFNRSMEEILEIDADQLHGKPIQTFADPENADQITRIFKKVKGSGKAEKVSGLEFKTWNNNLCSVETSVSLIQDKSHTPVGFSGVVRDVTQRKRSEKALRLSEEMFSKAFRSSPSGMFIATMASGKLINVNDSLLRFTGYSLFELMGKHLPAVGFFKDRSEYDRLIKNLKSKGRIEQQEIQFCTISGDVKTGVISAEMVKLWGDACILASLEDISESRQLERQILNISERERQKISMELHDDLCPQLIGIEVMTKILKEKLETDADDKVRDAEKIRTFILDAIAKTRQLSKGLSPVNLSAMGFDASLTELSQYVREVFGVPCLLEYDPAVHIQDNNVATHMYYIIHEAVINAIKHATAAQVMIRLTTGDDKIIVSIKDDGSGIPDTGPLKGMGIQLMKYRAGRIGATLDISRRASKGTHVRIEMER